MATAESTPLGTPQADMAGPHHRNQGANRPIRLQPSESNKKEDHGAPQRARSPLNACRSSNEVRGDCLRLLLGDCLRQLRVGQSWLVDASPGLLDTGSSVKVSLKGCMAQKLASGQVEARSYRLLNRASKPTDVAPLCYDVPLRGYFAYGHSEMGYPHARHDLIV